MFPTFLFISLYLAVCSAGPLTAGLGKGSYNSYIVGGTEAAAGEMPWIVSLSYKGEFGCGGSIISNRTILTAAHCMIRLVPDFLQIRAGSLRYSQGGSQVNVSRIVVHPQFNEETLDNDIALLILSADVPIDGTNVVAVNLAAANSEPSAGTTVMVAGWGTASDHYYLPETILHKVEVQVLSRSSCQRQRMTPKITEHMICAGVDAGGKDACDGDSGGPLTQGNTQVGIVSFGHGCALKSYAGVYTSVGAFREWIDLHTV